MLSTSESRVTGLEAFAPQFPIQQALLITQEVDHMTVETTENFSFVK